MAVLKYNRKECIGAGACEIAAPAIFKVEDGKAVVRDGKELNSIIVRKLKPDEIGKVKEACTACPVQCIWVEDGD